MVLKNLFKSKKTIKSKETIKRERLINNLDKLSKEELKSRILIKRESIEKIPACPGLINMLDKQFIVEEYYKQKFGEDL